MFSSNEFVYIFLIHNFFIIYNIFPIKTTNLDV